MHRLVKFGEGSSEYYFPVEQVSYRDNFRDLVTKTQRMAFANGGLDELGTGRGLAEIGSVQVEFRLQYDNVSDGLSDLQTLAKLNDWGKLRLFRRPLNDQAATLQWCVARMNNNPYTQNVHDRPHERQLVKLTFQVSDPFWYTAGNQNLWDSTYTFNSAITWDGGSFTTITGSGTLSVTNNGNAYTLGRFVARVSGATTFNRLIVRRLVNNGVIDQWELQKSLVTNDVIEVDPRKQWVIVNGVDCIANFTYRHPDWLRLLPGTNSISVTLDEAAAQISAKVLYYERYIE